jgi:hypothetical protein
MGPWSLHPRTGFSATGSEGGGGLSSAPSAPCRYDSPPMSPTLFRPPVPRVIRGRAAAPLALGLAIAATTLAGCGQAAATPAPDPASACAGADVQRAAGFYPDLESVVPTTLAGVTASIRDSGRYCSKKMLGPLYAAGHQEVRFAGATFPDTSQSGISLIAYAAPGITADEVAAAFRAGSGTGRKIEIVSDDPRDVGGREGRRIELINGDTRQVIVLWPATVADQVRIVIGVDVSNAAIDAAVADFDASAQGDAG